MVSDKILVSQTHIPANKGGGAIVKQGQRVKVGNPQGHQIGDLFAFVLDNSGEFLSPTITVGELRRIYPRVGDSLYSNLFNPLLTIEEDLVGVNDLLFQACDSLQYERMGQLKHPSCRDNLNTVLKEFGVTPINPPHPVNLFQNTQIVNLEGEIEERESPANPGDYVMLEALKDLLVVVTACPWDQGPTNGDKPTDLMLEVFK